jgi:septal ring factor EnvC (AmiA/AmiB activator)
MEENKAPFKRPASLFAAFLLLGAFNLYAQNSAGAKAPDQNPAADATAAFEERFSTAVQNFNKDVDALRGSLQEIRQRQDQLDLAFNKISKSQIWRIVSSVSQAFIALLFLGAFALFLLKHPQTHQNKDRKAKPARDMPKDPSPAEESAVASAEFNVLKSDLANFQIQTKQLTDEVNLQAKTIEHLENYLDSFKSEITEVKEKLRAAREEFASLKTDIGKNQQKLAWKEEVESNPVAAYNQWAQNPRRPLPQYFTYIANVKPEFRVKQDFADTNNETDWIRNTIGEKKYLFPNPNLIDNLSGPVDKLYKVTGARKSKGTNSVKATNPCQIMDNNFIEYQGELLLL